MKKIVILSITICIFILFSQLSYAETITKGQALTEEVEKILTDLQDEWPYDIEVHYQKSGCNIVIHFDGREDNIDDSYIHLNNYGDKLWTMTKYMDGSVEMLYE